MQSNKIIRIILFIVFAIPIPFSLMSWIGTLISLGAFSGVNWGYWKTALQAIIFLIVMLLAGTYIISYGIALRVTFASGKISFITFLPVFHLVLFFILYKISL